VDEWEALNENKDIHTTSSTQTTSTTTWSTALTATFTSPFYHYNSSNDPSYNSYGSYNSYNYNDIAEYEDYESYDYNESSDYYNWYDYTSIYGGSDNYEWRDSDDWYEYYDLYEWDSDLSDWVVVSTTLDTPASPITTTILAETTSDLYTASYTLDSNAQCGISSSLLLEIPEDPGSALISFKDPPSGIQMIEVGNVIINGKDVSDPTLFPWMAALRTNSGFHYCGGAVISQWWVLTAAHCEFEKTASVVVTGTLARSNGAGETITRASAVFNHPKADLTPYGTWQYDLSLINLKTALMFSDYIQPICLPSHGQNYVGQACHLAGWGRTDSNPAEYTEELQQATMRVDSFCGAYQPLLDYDESFCAGFHQDNSGCNGDSGSPLVCRQEDSFVVAGITSWASGACHGEEPTVYANVAAHVNWIHQVMSDK